MALLPVARTIERHYRRPIAIGDGWQCKLDVSAQVDAVAVGRVEAPQRLTAGGLGLEGAEYGVSLIGVIHRTRIVNIPHDKGEYPPAETASGGV